MRIFDLLFRLYTKVFWSYEKQAIKSGVKIGANCDIQNVSFGSEPYLITVGNHVQITSGTKIFTHGAAWVLRLKYPDMDFFGRVVIKDNVYIGNNCLIMPGVIIGSNVIIAAGSVVTKSIPDGCVVGGNPSRVIGDINSFENKMSEVNLKCKGMNSQDKRKFFLSLPKHNFLKKKTMSTDC